MFSQPLDKFIEIKLKILNLANDIDSYSFKYQLSAFCIAKKDCLWLKGSDACLDYKLLLL